MELTVSTLFITIYRSTVSQNVGVIYCVKFKAYTAEINSEAAKRSIISLTFLDTQVVRKVSFRTVIMIMIKIHLKLKKINLQIITELRRIKSHGLIVRGELITDC